jgi:hypothetical protein
MLTIFNGGAELYSKMIDVVSKSQILAMGISLNKFKTRFLIGQGWCININIKHIAEPF